MNHRSALVWGLLMIAAFCAVYAEEAAPFTPASEEQSACGSAALTGAGANSPELPLFTPEPDVKCVACSLDRHRDCDAQCVQGGFLWGACCACSTKCLCSGQDPADVC